MYTLMMTLCILSFITLIIGTIGYYVYWGIQKVSHKDNQNFSSLYNKDEEVIAEQQAIKKLVNPKIAIIFVLGSAFFITGIWVSSYNLSKLECAENNGAFTSWDNNLQWECYNPSGIDQENNYRIIHD